MPHSSTSTGTPPRVQTVSTIRRQSLALQMSPTPSICCIVPAELSPWHRNITCGLWVSMAVLSSSREYVLPASFCRLITSPPKRSASSHTRLPQIPLLPTRTFSPGSRMLATAASIAAWPLPLTAMVYLLFVWHKYLRYSEMSSIILRKGGCICPSCGRAMAAKHSGCELLGPGPMRMRCGTTRGTPTAGLWASETVAKHLEF
mmetsp:Transcript_39370/g.47738  ORF Transcript_39370/g.47738 Transcript_39370/m.47738 type:complete len:203 (-) Transcript_39370:159-767(-)